MGDLTENFDSSEFACNCGCGYDRMVRVFVFKLQRVRERAGFPFKVTSGCRCEQHNHDEGGKNDSDHLTGEGADIEVVSGRQRYKLVEAAIEVGLTRIGVARTFIHLGEGRSNAPMVIWAY